MSLRHTSVIKFAATLALISLLVWGCHTPRKPHQRVGAFFGNPLGMTFPDPNHLGEHRFSSGWSEKNGMVYTSRGGFIDIAHLRESADRTLYLQEIAFGNIINGRPCFTFRMIEPSSYMVTIHYPQNWQNLPEEKRKEIAEEVSIYIGQYLAHTTTVWHEIITWFGFASVPFCPETPSSFSWEDCYSDLLGTRLAGQAIRDKTQDFEHSLTALIDRQLQYLGVQPARVARQAEETVKTKWFSRKYFTITMNKRNFDIGDGNGLIRPWLVPGICPDGKPLSYPAPDLKTINERGFSIDVTMDPAEKQGRTVLAIARPGGAERHLQPSNDFPAIMQYIKDQAHKQCGPDVDVPKL